MKCHECGIIEPLIGVPETDGLAFSLAHEDCKKEKSTGLVEVTLLDQFAMRAMAHFDPKNPAGILQRIRKALGLSYTERGGDFGTIASQSYQLARAMLAEREANHAGR